MKETMLSKYLKTSSIEANKIEMAILYLLSNCKLKNINYVYQTYIYKFISHLEWEAAIKYANHFFMMDFSAMEKGPVPISFYHYIKNEGKFHYFKYWKNNNGETKFYLENEKSFNLFKWDYFSEVEKEILKKTTEFYIECLGFKKTKIVIDYTHEKMKSWRKAWNEAQKENKKAYNFDFSSDIIMDDKEEKEEIINIYKEFQYKHHDN